jgi:hypothetical protein
VFWAGLLLVLAACQAAFSWGPAGHKIIGQIAEQHLNPAALAAVRQILGSGGHLADIANLADDLRNAETAPWHYVNIPIDAAVFDRRRYCPGDRCVVGAIERFRDQLRDPAATAELRYEALYNVVHFVGDLHQPLHCGDRGDRGGNDVRVEFRGEATNLHKVWDEGILEWILQSRRADWEAFARNEGKISRSRRVSWSRGTPESWAMESHDLAREAAYRFPEDGAGPVVLSMDYVRRSVPVVRSQLAKAGIRLAYVLNVALVQGRR